MAKVGRKNKYEEFKDTSLLNMTTSYLIANWYSFTKEEKIKIALTIAPKGISDKHEIKGSMDVSSILGRMALSQ